MLAIERSSHIKHRYEFPTLCNARGIKVAVELGTDIGAYAAEFMKEFKGELICVDNYEEYEWMPHSRLPDMLMAINALQPYHPRARIVMDDSVALADRLPRWITSRLGFVYIDATHEFDSVLSEIKAWWPLIREGGLLAGHDYSPESHPEVVQAVNEFADANNLTLYTVMGDYIPSWYLDKAES